MKEGEGMQITRRLKKSLSILLVVIMAFSLFPAHAPAAAAQTSFHDVASSDWYYNAVNFAVDKGLFNGTSATTFSPDVVMTRGMFVTVLGRMAGVDTSLYQTAQFADVPRSMYYTPYINWANKNGIVNGIDTFTFKPDQPLTRQDLVTILFRYVTNTGGDNATASDNPYYAFSDYNSTGGYAVSAMKWAVYHGVIKGSNNRLAPLDNATRAQVAQIFYNAFDLINSGSGGGPRMGVYTCYKDKNGTTYTSDTRPSMTLKEDKTFSLVINSGEGMGKCSGTWRSYEAAESGETMVELTVTAPSGWSDGKSYTFVITPSGDLMNWYGYIGITPDDSVFTYDGKAPSFEGDLGVQAEMLSTAIDDVIDSLTGGGTVSVAAEDIMTGAYEAAVKLQTEGVISGLGTENGVIFFTYQDGTDGTIVMELPQDEDAALSGLAEAEPLLLDFSAEPSSEPDTAEDTTAELMANNVVGNKKLLFLSDLPSASNLSIDKRLRANTRGIEVTNNKIYYKNLLSINQYGVVIISSCKVYSLEGEPYLMLADSYSAATASSKFEKERKDKIVRLACVISPNNPQISKQADGTLAKSTSYTNEHNYILKTRQFFKSYFTDMGPFPNTHLHLGYIDSLNANFNQNFYKECAAAGIRAVTGYSSVVQVTQEVAILNKMIDVMMYSDKDHELLNAEKAFVNAGIARAKFTQTYYYYENGKVLKGTRGLTNDLLVSTNADASNLMWWDEETSEPTFGSAALTITSAKFEYFDEGGWTTRPSEKVTLTVRNDGDGAATGFTLILSPSNTYTGLPHSSSVSWRIYRFSLDNNGPQEELQAISELKLGPIPAGEEVSFSFITRYAYAKTAEGVVFKPLTHYWARIVSHPDDEDLYINGDSDRINWGNVSKLNKDPYWVEIELVE